MNLEDYKNLITIPLCQWCNSKNETIVLTNEPIEHYDHSGGWTVDGLKGKQWLYITCPKCEYQWALSKLGVRREL